MQTYKTEKNYFVTWRLAYYYHVWRMNIADYNEHHKLPVGLNRRGSNTDARKRILR